VSRLRHDGGNSLRHGRNECVNSRAGHRSRVIGRDANRAGIVLRIVVIDPVDDQQRLRKE